MPRERGAACCTRTRCVGARREAALAASASSTQAAGGARGRGAGARQRRRPLGRRSCSASGWASTRRQPRAAGQGQPHRRAAALRRHDHAYILQNDRRADRLRHPLRATTSRLIGTTDVAYDGDPATAAITPSETDYLCRGRQPLFPAASHAGRRGLDLCGRAAALRRCQRQRLGGDARLRASTSTPAPGARRCCRCSAARSRPTAGWPSMRSRSCSRSCGFAPGAWTATPPCRAATCPDADFAAFLDAAPARHPWLPAGRWRAGSPAPTARAPAHAGRRRGIDDLGRHFGGGLYEAELDYLWREEWARERRRRPLAAHQAGPAGRRRDRGRARSRPGCAERAGGAPA